MKEKRLKVIVEGRITGKEMGSIKGAQEMPCQTVIGEVSGKVNTPNPCPNYTPNPCPAYEITPPCAAATFQLAKYVIAIGPLA